MPNVLSISKTNGTAPYIGVEKKPSGEWTYSDGTPLIYQNWNNGEPQSTSNSSICAVLDPRNGKWNAAECSFARPFACSINHDEAVCPDEWMPFQNQCYYLRNFTLVNGKWQLYLYEDAEKECINVGSHLASIHSKEEHDFIFDLIYANVNGMTGPSPDSHPCNWGWAFIGLTGTGAANDSTWTDGSPTDFLGYPLNVTSTFRYWVISNDHSCNLWRWGSNAATEATARFVCKKPVEALKLNQPKTKTTKTPEKRPRKAAKFGCPAGFSQFPEENACFVFVSKPAFYVDAIRGCNQLGSVVVKIQNILENSYLFGLMSAVKGQAYIGVEKKPTGEWTYGNGETLLYQNWDVDEPSNASNSSICAVIDPDSGKWKAAECSFARPFICLFADQGNRCPYQWHYLEKSNSCYYLKDFALDPLGMWISYNFTYAESWCSEIGGKDSHLVSIHSMEELEFVYDLIYSNVAGMSNVASNNDSCRFQPAYSGLYVDGYMEDSTATWSDASPFDFVPYPYMYYGTYDKYLWVMQNDKSCNVKGWQGTSKRTIWRLVSYAKCQQRQCNLLFVVIFLIDHK
ncbi:unnamed protein product, partial [Mesorhabditis belari]|uniref:C-type lectin domain-containing protein n=1 Tax=Mesorhabditis belari TaxID=2138241 RepID=A0AAF3EFJ6_9BILA